MRRAIGRFIEWALGYEHDVAIKLIDDKTISVWGGSAPEVPMKMMHGDAGYDLFVSRDTCVQSMATMDVPTGVYVALPPGLWLEIRGRSSSVRQKRLQVQDAVIDNGYRGEVFICVINLGAAPYTIKRGERVAQLIPRRLVDLRFREVETLPPSERGPHGFGSTGK